MIKRTFATMTGFTLAVFGVDAGAVALNPNGIGQVLLYPYYTVNKGQDTLITVVNADRSASSIVKLRFNEGLNGRPVLELDLFLGRGDVWTAAITASGADRAKLVTGDTSCTIPAVPAEGLEFTTANFDGRGMPADAWPNSFARTREGSIEMISSATIRADAPAEREINRADGARPDCARLRASLPGPDDLFFGSGISGSGAIVNVLEGTFFSYTPEAIAGFSNESLYTPASGPLQPSLAQPWTQPGPVFSNLWSGQQITYPTRIDAVSAVLMSSELDNEYLVARDLGAATDWIVTFPTKAFYTDPVHTGSGGPRAPFVEPLVDGRSTSKANRLLFDRDQGRPSAQGAALTLPYQVNALSFRADVAESGASGVLGSNLATTIPAYGAAGWMALDLDPQSDPSVRHALTTGTYIGPIVTTGAENSPVDLYGLPAVGFMAYNIINANAQPGKLANYSGAFRHHARYWGCMRASVPCGFGG